LGGWLDQAHTQGVGNELVCEHTQENEQNNYKIHKLCTRKRWKIVTQVEYALAEACGRILAAFPLVAGKFLQKPASKACWKC